MKVLIGLTAKKQSGKTTISNHLINKYGYTKYSYADSLKKSLQEIFYFTDEEVFGDKKEEVNEYWGYSPREIMQYYGSEIMRETLGKIFPKIGNNIWTRSVEYKMDRDNKDLIVIDDVRFNNEIEFIREYGKKHNYKTYIINIQRNFKLEEINEEFKGHQSENQQMDYDYKIVNTTIEDTYKRVDEIIEEINKDK